MSVQVEIFTKPFKIIQDEKFKKYQNFVIENEFFNGPMTQRENIGKWLQDKAYQ